MFLKGEQGASLLDLVVAVALTGVLAAVCAAMLVASQRTVQATAERLATSGSVRSGLQVIVEELRGTGRTNPGNGDLVVQAAGSVTYRAPRGFGRICRLGPSSVWLDRSPPRFVALRLPSPGRDTLLVFDGGDASTAADDRWVPLPILGPPTSAVCPAGSPALVVPTIDLTPLILAGLGPDGPVRWFEIMTLRSYASGGDLWLGGQSITAGEVVQPIVGPLDTPGLQLIYADGHGLPASGDAVRLVVTRLGVRASGVLASGGGAASHLTLDRSIRVEVALRNRLP